MQLRRCVEYAGMVDRCDFTEQASLPTADGAVQRPDLVVRLTGGRSLVVDAKVTLAAYLESLESDDEKRAHERMAAHARHLRKHVDRLADKAYWAACRDSPEFVVLFVPGEAFLAPALEHDPSLLEHAYARRVHLATPTTLISLLRTVAHAWQQESLTENARAVVTAGQENSTPVWALWATTWTSSAARWGPRSLTSTRPSRRWSARCSPPPGGSPTCRAPPRLRCRRVRSRSCRDRSVRPSCCPP